MRMRKFLVLITSVWAKIHKFLLMIAIIILIDNRKNNNT